AREEASLGEGRDWMGGSRETDDSLPTASWGRLWRELRLTARLRFVLPASFISLLLGASELLAPRLRGELFDAVVRPGTQWHELSGRLRVLAFLSVAGWIGNIISSVGLRRKREGRRGVAGQGRRVLVRKKVRGGRRGWQRCAGDGRGGEGRAVEC
ncbi:MAG: hypothetical protein SGPRY_008372, partial [Prymnesium sp.]